MQQQNNTVKACPFVCRGCTIKMVLQFSNLYHYLFNLQSVFLQVIHKHFYLKRVEIMTQCEEWIADIQQYSSDKRVGRTMSHHAAALKVRFTDEITAHDSVKPF